MNELHVTIGDETTCFTTGDTVTIGRDPGCSVVVVDPTVSRTHVSLRYDGGSWVVEDRSSGGTYTDDGRIRAATVAGSQSLHLGRPSGPAVRLSVAQPVAVPRPGWDEGGETLAPPPVDNGLGGAMKERAPRLGSIVPVKAWAAQQSKWRSMPVLVFLAMAITPFVLMGLTDGDTNPMGVAAWGFCGMTAALCAGGMWALVRPGKVDPKLVALVTGSTFLLVAFPIVAGIERSLGSPGNGDVFGYVFKVGLVEELAKALPVFVFLYLAGRERFSTRTYLYLGALSGVAFGAVEAVQYMRGLSILPDKVVEQTGTAVHYGPLAVSIVGRVFFGPAMHMVFAGLVAYFIGLAAHNPRWRAQLIGASLGTVAIAHGVYDAIGGWLGTGIAIASILTFTGYVVMGNRLEEGTTSQTPPSLPVPAAA